MVTGGGGIRRGAVGTRAELGLGTYALPTSSILGKKNKNKIKYLASSLEYVSYVP